MDVILAEAAVAGVVDLADDGDRLGLAHGDHSDRVGAAVGALGGLVDAVEGRSEGCGGDAVHGGGSRHVGVVIFFHHLFFVISLWCSLQIVHVTATEWEVRCVSGSGGLRMNPRATTGRCTFHSFILDVRRDDVVWKKIETTHL